ncbi:MAG: L,D-transpeptidase [Desulfitobacteriaceae bacterium]|nr:L,D-transpeptidase [Desulfitobacteriaceae bacterium]MDI6878039.1 L,D-transpeptidase [Desulfitobacteriaceae bacterium]MDI6913909.1 L,D-transpeptidase [Desulfitobacteriaceae bacterium]
MPERHIVIRKSQRLLELYEGPRLLGRYPIAIGRAGTPTPEGRFTIAEKRTNPGGVFGSRWLGLSSAHYGIHGTNNPASIGQAVSKGCIRMHNRDVERLFEKVAPGTPVNIYRN